MQMLDQKRKQDMQDWMAKEQWKLQNQQPEMTGFQTELAAAGIDPNSEQGRELVRRKVNNTADPLVPMPSADKAPGVPYLRAVPRSALVGASTPTPSGPSGPWEHGWSFQGAHPH